VTPASPRRARVVERGLVAAIAAAFVLTAAMVVIVAPQFTWDEAVYALTARRWLGEGPATGWGPHRPLILSLLGMIPLTLGFAQEAAFRVFGLAFGAGMIGATWFLARSLAGPVAGVGAALAVAAAPTLAGDAGLFLTDVPATAVLMVVVALLWRAMERSDAPGKDLLWVAPVAAAAFYIRYGSIVPLLALAVAAAVVWPTKLVAGWRTVVATLALTVVLLIPHAIFAAALTGSPFGIALAAQSGAHPAFAGEALLAYLAMLPAGLAGFVPGMLIGIGVATCSVRVLAGRRPSGDRATRALVLLVLAALVQLAVLGIFILPQVRYIFLAIVLLIVAGCIALTELLAHRGTAGRLALVGVAAGLVVSLGLNPFVLRANATESLAAYAWERELGIRIGQLTPGACSVLASDVPQITWYSGCYAYNFGNRAIEGDRDSLLVYGERFLVVRTDGLFQPQGNLMAGYQARAEPQPVAVMRRSDGSVAARLYRFR
jgi:hypothetical protein